MKLRSLSEDQIDKDNVAAIDDRRVTQHPGYSNLTVQDNSWAWAQKQADGKRNVSYTRKSHLGSRTAYWRPRLGN